MSEWNKTIQKMLADEQAGDQAMTAPQSRRLAMVTDEDRKAAAEIYQNRRDHDMHKWILYGRCDADPIVRAFARQRLLGYQQGMEDAAGALEADAQLCDCHAHSESECACGAWCEWKTITSARAVEIVRAKAEEKKHG